MVKRRDLFRDIALGAGGLLLSRTMRGLGSAMAAAATDILKVGQFVPPNVSLDPGIETTDHVLGLLRNVYEPLVDLDGSSMKLTGVLATNWSVSPDIREYTFELRRGVRFSDGTPFNASAAKASVERVLTLKKGPFWFAKNIAEVEARSEFTLVLRLSNAFPLLSAMRSIPMISPSSIVSKAVNGDSAQEWLSNHSAGTGAYMVDHWTPGTEWVLVKNPLWPGWASREATHKVFTKVVIRDIPETSTQSLMLKRGDLDVALRYNGETIREFERTPGIGVHKSPSLQQLYIPLNTVVGPTKDVRVRQALSYAWDPKALDAVLPDTFVPTDGPIPRELLGGHVPKSLYPYDLDRAKQLLAAAGYPNGGFTLTYWGVTGDEIKRLTGELLQSQLAKLNIKVETRATTGPAQIAAINEWMKTRDPNKATGIFSLLTGPRFPDPYAIAWFLYHTDAASGDGRNWGCYSDPIVDGLIRQGVAAVSRPAREQELYRQLSELILQAAPDIFGGKFTEAVPMKATIRGFVPRPANSRQILFYDLWLA